MLGRLLKYDLKWVYKVIVIFYILTISFSCIGRGISYIENSVVFSVVTQITYVIAISMMVTSLINCMMRLWVRFIKNMYKDESYLTHTLPVKKKTIYASKVITACITIFTTVIVILACLFICYYSEENLQVLKSGLELAASTYDTTVLNLILLIALVILMQIIFIVLLGYVAAILGHKSNKNKMVNSIAIGFGLYMITQIVTLVLVCCIGFFSPDIMNLINTVDTVNVEIIKYLMYAAIGMYIVYIGFYYILGKKNLEKGVNVD